MHFILTRDLDIKNGYADSDRSWKLCSYDTPGKASFFQECEIPSNCHEETQRASSNILDFRKIHFFQNFISQGPEYEILPEGCLGLMCSWNYQNHEHEWLWGNSAVWNRATAGCWVKKLWDYVAPSPKDESHNDIVYGGAHMMLSAGDLHPLPLCGHFPWAVCLESSLPYGKWG